MRESRIRSSIISSLITASLISTLCLMWSISSCISWSVGDIFVLPHGMLITAAIVIEITATMHSMITVFFFMAFF